MATHPYHYLKLLLHSKLLLDLDEFDLINTKQQGLVCLFMGMRLSSTFQPVVRMNGKVVGRKAMLCASIYEHGDGKLTPEGSFDYAFDYAMEAHRLVQFDRLVRTIHLLNYSNNFDEHEQLFLSVHPHLLTSVSDHGHTFEQILHYYSLPTSRVFIEIKESAVKDEVLLHKAVSNYRNLGYKIALEGFGTAHSGLERAINLHPDIVKLDSILIQNAENSDSVTSVLKQLIKEFQSTGIQVAIKGIETTRQLEIARKSGADLLQGSCLGRPQSSADARGQLCRGERLAA